MRYYSRSHQSRVTQETRIVIRPLLRFYLLEKLMRATQQRTPIRERGKSRLRMHRNHRNILFKYDIYVINMQYTLLM